MQSGDTNASGGIQFVGAALPDQGQLIACKANSASDDDFMKCVLSNALPAEYRISADCLANNPGDMARALACSTNDQSVTNAYDKFKKISDCASSQGNTQAAVASCLGESVLNADEQYNLQCVLRNSGSYGGMAACALSNRLNPTQQIAVSCAASSGGNPYAFAGCTGGQLLAVELPKCWAHGIGTDDGCFGKNNEYTKAMNLMDQSVQHIFPPNTAAYEAWSFWVHNTLAPNAQSIVVKNLNGVIRDIRSGHISNQNEGVIVVRGAAKIVHSIGKVFGL